MKTLFEDKLQDSIDVLRRYEPVRGYYLAFSGGKDSVVLHDVAIKAGVKFETHFNNTMLEAPETMRFIREYYPHAVWDKPKKQCDRRSRRSNILLQDKRGIAVKC